MDETALTFGEQAVGLSFNPDQNEDVKELKTLYAQIIDKLEEIKGRNVSPSYMANTISGEALRTAMDAQMWAAMDAQMWAVKFATWKQ